MTLPPVVPGPPPGAQGEVLVDITILGPAVRGRRTEPLTNGLEEGSLAGPAPSWTGAGTVGAYGYSNQGVGVLGISDSLDGVQGRSSSPNHCGVSAVNDHGIALYGRGPTAGRFDGPVVVNGSLTVAGGSDIILADCAEEFACPGAAKLAPPGSVMVLDDDGSVRPCDTAYDPRAVGVVSGAGPYRPAIVLDRREEDPDRAQIALIGKVCCNVDATFAPIRVGDLLTSSPTRGHAMKATDPLAAFGAVIGKATEPLSDGRGQIRILVTLQ
jgi:hypothetical protein